MIKFSDDTTLEGLIHNSDESAYRGEVERLAGWCSENDLELNVSKTKEMVFDFRKKLLTIAGEVIEEVKSFKFLGTTISSDLKWDGNQESTPATFLPEVAKEIQSQSFPYWLSSTALQLGAFWHFLSLSGTAARVRKTKIS